MIKRKQRMTKLKAILLVAIIAAVFLALHFGPAAAQDNQETETIMTFVPAGSAQDTSCTAGPTGNCVVTYVALPPQAIADSQATCGADACWVRVEYRW